LAYFLGGLVPGLGQLVTGRWGTGTLLFTANLAALFADPPAAIGVVIWISLAIVGLRRLTRAIS
jgi:hypothetical protein